MKELLMTTDPAILLLIGLALTTILLLIYSQILYRCRSQIDTLDKKLSIDRSSLKPKEYLDYYYNVLTQKFNYWYKLKLLPYHLTMKNVNLTRNEINKVYEQFNADVIGTMNKKILTVLLAYYFKDADSIIINNREFFYSKFNDIEHKMINESGGIIDKRLFETSVQQNERSKE